MKEQKRPWLAGFLNLLLPGWGYFYVEDTIKGIIALFPAIFILFFIGFIFQYHLGLAILGGGIYLIYSLLCAREAFQAAKNYNLRLIDVDSEEWKENARDKAIIAAMPEEKKPPLEDSFAYKLTGLTGNTARIPFELKRTWERAKEEAKFSHKTPESSNDSQPVYKPVSIPMNARDYTVPQQYPRKSPLIARILSVLPGIGSFYAGQYITGIFWLIISIPLLVLTIYIYHLYASGILVHHYRSDFRVILTGIYIFLIYYSSTCASHEVEEYNLRQGLRESFEWEKEMREK